MTTATITAKCAVCKRKEVLTPQQINSARELGVAICSRCGNPMTVSRISGKARTCSRFTNH